MGTLDPPVRRVFWRSLSRPPTRAGVRTLSREPRRQTICLSTLETVRELPSLAWQGRPGYAGAFRHCDGDRGDSRARGGLVSSLRTGARASPLRRLHRIDSRDAAPDPAILDFLRTAARGNKTVSHAGCDFRAEPELQRVRGGELSGGHSVNSQDSDGGSFGPGNESHS